MLHFCYWRLSYWCRLPVLW